MKIVIENRIPFIQGILEPVAQVCYLPADGITPLAVADADALLVRTRTRCNAALLQGSRVRFIGSATIGTDHIDLDWCSTHGIAVANAPGCNAPAVAQWVFAAIALWMQRHHIAAPEGLTLGVIGVGHVGSIVARWGRQLGFNVLLNDPPRGIGAQLPSPSVRGRGEGWDLQAHGCSLDQLLCGSDIVTVHTPLTSTGQWPTWHLCDEHFLAFINDVEELRVFIQDWFLAVGEELRFNITQDSKPLRLNDEVFYNYLNYNTNI